MTMNLRTPTLADVIRVALERHGSDVHVSMPGVVLSYDATHQSAMVRPMLQARAQDPAGTGDWLPVALPDLPGVPVVFAGAGGARLTFPVATGDPCWLVFCDRSLDNWKSTTLGQVPVDPVAESQHAIADAVAFVGGRPFASPWAVAPTDRVTLGYDAGEQIEVLSGRVNLGAGASQPLVLGTSYQTHMNALSTALTALSAAITPLMLPPAVGAAKAAIQQAITAANELAADLSSTSFTN